MPLTLVPPRKGNPNYAIRGSYLHVKRLYRSTGVADEKLARKALQKLRRDIESGAFVPEAGPTFAGAAMSYLRAGGEARFIGPLNEYFQATPLDKIDQAAIDLAATTLYPGDPIETAPTRNRQVYTPVSAILKHAGREKALRRPKGARGKARLHWLQPEQAFALLAAAGHVGAKVERNEKGQFVVVSETEPSPNFEALCTFLLYTGCRLSEALRLEWKNVDLPASFAYVRNTKNGDPRPVFLPPVVVAALANLLNSAESGSITAPPPHHSVFRYTKGRWLYRLLDKAQEASGVTITPDIAFHIFRHTYGAWMRRHAGLDTSGLVATGAWKSKQAAAVYEHVEFAEEASKAALLPTRKMK